MSKNILMGKYSLVGCRTLIMYNVINERYVETVNLLCLSLFVLLYIYNINKRKFYKDFRYHKGRTNYSTQIVKTTRLP